MDHRCPGAFPGVPLRIDIGDKQYNMYPFVECVYDGSASSMENLSLRGKGQFKEFMPCSFGWIGAPLVILVKGMQKCPKTIAWRGLKQVTINFQ